jgi:hypothetical protein
MLSNYYSNTTLVKVKLAIKFFATVIVVNSNTTLVKVKFYPYGSDIGKT